MSNEVTLYENKKQDISIHIFGPYDRFNFGDLLFPIVLEHYLKVNISQANCCFFGTFNFDLTKRGGYHGRGYTELIKSLSKQKNRIVIVGVEKFLVPHGIYYIFIKANGIHFYVQINSSKSY